MIKLDFDSIQENVIGYCGFSRPLGHGANRLAAESHLKYLCEKGLTIKTDSLLLNRSFPTILLDHSDVFDLTNRELMQGKVSEYTAYFFHDLAELVHCRQSSSRFNKIIAYDMVQLRKSESYFIYNSRTFQELDKRVRQKSCAFDCVYGKGGVNLTKIGTKERFLLE